MSQHDKPPSAGGAHPFQPGQTIIFMGDHTSPDEPGYVEVISGVLARFYPQLRLNLISAGSRGQTAAALRSRAFLDLLTSARPDWLALGIGMADALREPVAAKMLQEMRDRSAEQEEAIEAMFGPEHAPRGDTEPPSDAGTPPEPALTRLEPFKQDLSLGVAELQQSGVRPILMSIAPPGDGSYRPLNNLVNAYSRGMREIAQQREVPLVDLERAFRDMYDRAANYKQRVRLTTPDGKLNTQGQTLIARTFLFTFGLLPRPGSGR